MMRTAQLVALCSVKRIDMRGALHLPHFLLGSVLMIALATLSAPAVAQETEKQLKEIETTIEKQRRESAVLQKKAEALSRDVESLQRELVSAAAVAQATETEIIRLTDKMHKLDQDVAKKKKRLDRDKKQFVNVLAALQRMSLYPPEALLAQPRSPDDTVRAAVLLRTSVPHIEDRAARLRVDLDALARAREDAGRHRAQLEQTAARATTQRKQLDALMAKKLALKSDALKKSQQAARRVEKLAGDAKNLRDLMASLARERKAALQRNRQDEQQHMAALTSIPKISGLRGRLPFPVVGRLAGRYGEVLKTGLTRKGITIETSPNAPVISPHDGHVVFAGQFRGYGLLLIIEHGEGYHSLLAGMDRIDTAIGQSVLAGEPVAVMADAQRLQSGMGNPVLYVELRRDNHPINPMPWLAARNGKTKG